LLKIKSLNKIARSGGNLKLINKKKSKEFAKISSG
jgi:hypothetical protein